MRYRSLVCAVTSAALLAGGAGDAQAGMSVHVLSNRANLISGSEVLASVDLPGHVKPGR